MMKRSYFFAAPLALGLLIGSLQVAPMLAQSQSQPDAQQEQQKSQTFVGKVIKTKSGQFALLTDEQAGNVFTWTIRKRPKRLKVRTSKSQAFWK